MNATQVVTIVGFGVAALTAGLMMMGSGTSPAFAGEAAEGGEHAAKVLGTADFDQAVTSGVVLVDFWAPWCGPCRKQGPIVEAVAKAVGKQAVVAKVNVDENQILAQRYQVSSIPTLILFKDGKIVKRMVGLQQERALVEAVEQAVGKKLEAQR